jgi:hypothetical protein
VQLEELGKLKKKSMTSSGIDPAILRLVTFFLACETIGTAATSGLLCQPRVMVKMIVEKQMECRLAGET